MTAPAKPASKPKPAPKPVKVEITVRNRLLHNDGIGSAKVEITGGTPPVSVTATTNKWGSTTVDLNALPDGVYNLRVTAPHTSADPVGAATATMASPPARIYRVLNVTITVKTGTIPSASIPAADVLNGSVETPSSPTHLTVNVQPVWITSPYHKARSGSARDVVDLIIVHHTGGSKISNALNHFIGGGEASAGYVIDVDGQIVKMVQDERAANQAGTSFWDGVRGVNGTSIGIEVVNASGAYPVAQYTALIALLKSLTVAYAIPRRRIVGHSDVATDKGGLLILGRKSSDPGIDFEWTRLEAESLGLVPRGTGMDAKTAYGGYFDVFAGADLRKGDKDATHKLGGTVRKAFTGTPVKELQEDLSAIGYSVGTADGEFTRRTEAAVQMFQEHFFGGTRKGGLLNGHVDRATADMIKQVRP